MKNQYNILFYKNSKHLISIDHYPLGSSNKISHLLFEIPPQFFPLVILQ
jgi:hypothetical protein